jgi:hypothetical protein
VAAAEVAAEEVAAAEVAEEEVAPAAWVAPAEAAFGAGVEAAVFAGEGVETSRRRRRHRRLHPHIRREKRSTTPSR